MCFFLCYLLFEGVLMVFCSKPCLLQPCFHVAGILVGRLAVRVCWSRHTKMVSVITRGVLHGTSSGVSPLPGHDIISYCSKRIIVY